jgi:hypothetical protein
MASLRLAQAKTTLTKEPKTGTSVVENHTLEMRQA